MSRSVQQIVLCEDQQSQVFIRRALARFGIKGQLRFCALPSGGAADKYVLDNYAKEVVAARRRLAKADTALIVHIDADPENTVAERHAQLAERLVEQSLPPRALAEPIVELIPKRNIETWIHALDPTLRPALARPLDEETAYPRLKLEESLCANAAESFADHAKAKTSPPSAATVPSLLDGLTEFRRLP